MFRIEYLPNVSKIIWEETNKSVGLIDNSYLEDFCQLLGVALSSDIIEKIKEEDIEEKIK